MRLQGLPNAVTIEPGCQTLDLQRPRPEARSEARLQPFCLPWLDLVLDGDVRPPRGAVLRNQQTAKHIGQIGAHFLQFIAVDAKRRTLPQIDDPGDEGAWRRSGGAGGELRAKLLLHARREMA